MFYGTAEGFADYQTARGRTIPGTWDDTAIEAALLSASEWLDGIYGPSFIGYKTGGFLQDREWPRTTAVIESAIPPYIFATDEMPERVEQATYEAAFRQLTAPGSLQIDYVPTKYKTVEVIGAIRVDYQQFVNATDVQTQISVVETLLWPLIDCGSPSSMSGLSGSVTR